MSEFENILVELIFIFLHFLLFLINYKVMKKVLMQPAVLFSLLWFIIISLHFIFRLSILDELYPVHLQTFIIFFVGALCFSFGSFLTVSYYQKKTLSGAGAHFTDLKSPMPLSVTLRFILSGFLLVGLPFYIQAAYKLFIASNIENFFVGLRTQLSYGDEDIGPLKYLVSFSFVIYAINLYAYLKGKTKANKILLIGSLLLTITYAVFMTGRSLFFMILIVYFGMSYLHKANFSIRKNFWLIGTFLVAFILIGIYFGKGGDKEDSVKENILPAAQGTGIYLVSSLNALDWKLNHNPDINYQGLNTFRFFIKVGSQLHLIENAKVEDILQEFRFVPYPTNVYTFYSPYIEDYGTVFSWLMIGFFGVLHTLLNDRALLEKNLRYSLYYSFMLFPLLMSFFQDQYMSLFSSWFQIVVYIELFIIMNKFFIAKRW